MLFKHRFHPSIASGEITRTIRNWKRPQAKVGGRYRLSGTGTIEVTAVEPIEDSSLTEEDAARSGFDSLEALKSEALKKDPANDGRTLYRIDFRFIGKLPDPRAALAADASIEPDELNAIRDRLDRMDSRSARPWTRATLDQIATHPENVSHQLAAAIGFDTPPFKANVRKLKKLGLTISLERGYRLSPRGEAVLAQLRRQSRQSEQA